MEVKTRKTSSWYTPKTAVNAKKQQNILQSAKCYLSKHHVVLQPRFDVAEIYVTDQKKVYINYLENAYQNWCKEES